MVRLEKVTEPKILPLTHIDGQSFTIINIKKTEFVCHGNSNPGVIITTGEKFRDIDTKIQHNMFFTTRKYVIRYLTKESTLAKLKKNKSIGPFGCIKAGSMDTFPPLSELYTIQTDGPKEVVFGVPVLADSERKDLVLEARRFHIGFWHDLSNPEKNQSIFASIRTQSSCPGKDT